MPKTSEAYRGKDQTLEIIRARYEKIEENEHVDKRLPDGAATVEAYDQVKWNTTCEKIAHEMKAEGLNTTAEFVLSYKINH